jgi:predicted ATPase/DNA-binding winged helix-turn-helix (wHTH) protein
MCHCDRVWVTPTHGAKGKRLTDGTIREEAFAFGPYVLFRSQRLLREGDKPVHLGNRALDILTALIERSGEVVTKRELMKLVWPNTVVAENNLSVHIASLRRTINDGHGDARYIINIAGRGYSFIAPIRRVEVPAFDAKRELSAQRTFPKPLSRIVGRDDVIEAIVAQLARRRLVTIVGPGGVGKTTVSVSIAERIAKSYQQVCFVDLSTLEDPILVPSALASVIGIATTAEEPLARLIAHLRDLHMLIVLDNCEHVIASAAELVEHILGEAQSVDILATSREPLLAEAEYVYILAPLQCPPEFPKLAAEAALQYSAVQLLVERANSVVEGFELTDENVGAVSAVCRRIDGIPLAIELVAARLNLFGIDALAYGFADDLLLTTKGKRTADDRHQSLRATMDWSYRALAPIEQVVLRRLAVFRGVFSADSAAAVVSAGASSGTPVLDALLSLVGKCLLATDVSGSIIRYRLLHVTRAYASEQLTESGERDQISRRHAEHLRALLEDATERWQTTTRQQWLLQYGSMIDDVRAALDWSFSPSGNIECASTLTIATLPFGVRLSLIGESTKRAALALEVLSRVSPPKPLWEMRINNALVGLLWYSGAPTEELFRIIDRALALAEESATKTNLIEPLANRAVIQFQSANYDAARKSSKTLQDTAIQADDPIAILMAQRVGAQVEHFSGNHARAKSLAEGVLRHRERGAPLVYGAVAVDRHVSMRILLSRILWIEGYPDQAENLAWETLNLAKLDGPQAVCQALDLAACPIAFWRGDLQSAVQLTETLLDYAHRYSLDRYAALGLCYRASVDLLSSDAGNLELRMPEALSTSSLSTLQRDTLGTICDYWIDPPTLDRARRGLCGWASAEILRAAAARQHPRSIPNADGDLEANYLISLGMARAQKALAWELRTTTSLAGLWNRQGRAAEALQVMRAVYDRFDEGDETADLKVAKTLIEEL